MKRLLALPIAAMCMLISACTGFGTLAGPPPQAPAAVTNISRTALDFALHSFDAALYGLDFAMDSGRLRPGSDQARQIAAAGRSVMRFLGVAEAARDMGNSATYEEAFANANSALEQFRTLFPSRTALADPPPLDTAGRLRILARLEGVGAAGGQRVAR